MLYRLTSIASAFAGFFFIATEVGTAAPVNVGILSCDVSKGIGHFIVERQKMICEFRPASGSRERYDGKIADYGLEVGEIKAGHLVWSVLLAATQNLEPGALSGEYIGVSADVAAGVGAGANALIGGTHKGFILQPLSVEGETGINIAVGVRSLSLDAE